MFSSKMSELWHISIQSIVVYHCHASNVKHWTQRYLSISTWCESSVDVNFRFSFLPLCFLLLLSDVYSMLETRADKRIHLHVKSITVDAEQLSIKHFTTGLFCMHTWHPPQIIPHLRSLGKMFTRVLSCFYYVAWYYAFNQHFTESISSITIRIRCAHISIRFGYLVWCCGFNITLQFKLYSKIRPESIFFCNKLKNFKRFGIFAMLLGIESNVSHIVFDSAFNRKKNQMLSAMCFTTNKKKLHRQFEKKEWNEDTKWNEEKRKIHAKCKMQKRV